MKITTIGIDLAKNIFQIHGVDEGGKIMVRKQLKRAEMLPYLAHLAPCLIGMEACGSAHHWARKLRGFGHTVKLMAPQFVKPYVKTKLATWLGLVRRQKSSGGKQNLLGISKRWGHLSAYLDDTRCKIRHLSCRKKG